MPSIITNILSVFSTPATIVACLALILATSSFISGLQLVRGAIFIERKIHRMNGFCVVALFVILLALDVTQNGITALSFTGWLFGALLITLKIWIVRKRRKAFKYVSWVGGSLIVMWLVIVYLNIPV